LILTGQGDHSHAISQNTGPPPHRIEKTEHSTLNIQLSTPKSGAPSIRANL
jgi:hypothetical protein